MIKIEKYDSLQNFLESVGTAKMPTRSVQIIQKINVLCCIALMT